MTHEAVVILISYTVEGLKLLSRMNLRTESCETPQDINLPADGVLVDLPDCIILFILNLHSKLLPRINHTISN